GPPALQRMGIAGAALHRLDPGIAIERGIASDDPELRARALRAAGELGRVHLRAVLRREAAAEDAEVRFWAVWSGALLGDTSAAQPLERFVEDGGRRAVLAIELAARLSGGARSDAFLDYVAMRGGQRLTLLGATAIGDPASLA